MNDSAQLQVLEAVIVAGMLLLAIFFVRSIDVSIHLPMGRDNRFESYGNSIFTSLGGQKDPSGEYSSLLASYIADDSSHNSKLVNYVYEVLPSGTLFKISRVNVSMLMYNSTATLNNCTEVLYDPGIWINNEARVSRIVVANGFIYELIIYMWFNLER
jgi:hypothetical protein